MGINTEKEIWYLARDGKRHGPITDGEMRKLMELGHLKGDDLVWRPGYQEWRKALSVFSSQRLDRIFDKKTTPRPTYPKQRRDLPSQSSDQENDGDLKVSEEVRKSIASETSQLLRRERPPTPIQATPTQPIQKDVDAVPSSEDGETYEFEDDQENIPHQEQLSKSLFKRILQASTVLGFLGFIGIFGYMYSSQLKIGIDILTLVLSSKKDETSKKTVVAKTKITQTGAIEPQRVSKLKTNNDDQENKVDQTLQKSHLWALLKKEFPEWYNLQLDQIKMMQGEQRTETEINTKLLESLVALRRQRARIGLAASTDQFQKIALTFVSNLAVLEKKSVEDCYGYISKGEITPYAISVAQKPLEGEAFHSHIEAVMRAIVEGGKSPSLHEEPTKTDYDLLAKELSILGWSEADIQLFADPQTLSNAPPAQVCKMVREWFVAHLAISDVSARERLLYETLRPIIAG